MRTERSPFPSQQGTALAKDVWLASASASSSMTSPTAAGRATKQMAETGPRIIGHKPPSLTATTGHSPATQLRGPAGTSPT